MASTTPPPNERQPKIVQKLLLRTLILVVALGAILIGIRTYLESRVDSERNVSVDTTGWIAAIEFKEDGNEAVAIAPDLTVHRTEGWRKGAMDRDILWGPGGNFVYFASDRSGDSYHVYRWNPTGTQATERTVGKRSRSSLSFPLDPEQGSQEMLMTSGGIVMQFDPSKRTQYQELPPIGREIPVGEGDEAGAQSQFAALYGSIGHSFRAARWCGADDHIAAVMGRDEGEILIIQDTRVKDGTYPQPVRIAAGDHIEIDVNPKDGSLVYAVTNFQWPTQPPPQFIKDGKVSRPFWHYISMWTPEAPVQVPVVASNTNDMAFTSLAVHPDGTEFLAIAGPYTDGNVDHQVMVSFPTKSGGGTQGKPILQGAVFEPTWDPSGRLMAFAKTGEDGKRTIYTANRDGSSERNITGGKGDFGFPRFSPQTAGP